MDPMHEWCEVLCRYPYCESTKITSAHEKTKLNNKYISQVIAHDAPRPLNIL